MDTDVDIAMRRVAALVACSLAAGCSQRAPDVVSAHQGTVASATEAASGPETGQVEVRLTWPTIVTTASTGLFTHVVELGSGTVVAVGADDRATVGSNGAPQAVWRSTDGAVTFERLDPAALRLSGREEVTSVAAHDDDLYLFGSDWQTIEAHLWVSRDEGASWASELIGPGLATGGGVVGGRPTVALVEGAGADIGAAIYQRDVDGRWTASSIPDDGDQATVYALSERPDGSAVAVGTRCPTAPDCADEEEPAEIVVWLSTDGGRSWSETDRLEGLSAKSSPMVITDGPNTYAAFGGSDSDGVAQTGVIRVSSAGAAELVDERRWPDADNGVVWGIEHAGGSTIAVVGIDTADGWTPRVVIVDEQSGRNDVVDLRSATGLHTAFGSVVVDGTVFVVGVARTDDDFQPALVEIRP